MDSKSMVFRLPAAALLVALSLVGLDVVDSTRTVVVVGGYLWFTTFAGAALALIVGLLRSRTH
jgi:hypothetical protein